MVPLLRRDIGHVKARPASTGEVYSLLGDTTCWEGISVYIPVLTFPRPRSDCPRRVHIAYRGESKALAQSADFRALADMRVREAKFLLDGSEWSGAYYLIGYAVECGLKACLTRDLLAYQMPDKEFSKAFIHDIAKLAQIAQLDGPRALNAQTDHDFALNWNVVTNWNEESRYTLWTETQAKELYEAVTNANHGVLPWLKTFW